jgi:methyltransferase (TIGR00027 family)
MKQQHSSTTAEGMAIVRAIEMSRPEGRRIIHDDPLARRLVNGFSFTMSKLVIDSGLYARISRGTLEFITVRERYIDDFLTAHLEEGLDQVVILGAGFDTRAYRIPGIEKTRVFEIDHPATQEAKLARLKKLVNPLPSLVTFIPIDFNTQALGERLASRGYDERGKTLFIWQGVMMYLDAKGVDDTLAFISGHSGAGSAVIFDFFYNEFLQDTSRPDVKRLRRIMRVIDEEHIFGLDEGKVAEFLRRRGFSDVHVADPGELKRLYFTGANAGREIAQGAAIASARVKALPPHS